MVSTAASLPTGMNAKCYIGRNVQIGAHCSIYSAHIADEAVIGDNCVVLEGARIEKSAEIAPNSVVPPGRLIPTKQLWGGNPAVFIKDLSSNGTWLNGRKIGKGQQLPLEHNAEICFAAQHKKVFVFMSNEAHSESFPIELTSVYTVSKGRPHH